MKCNLVYKGMLDPIIILGIFSSWFVLTEHCLYICCQDLLCVTLNLWIYFHSTMRNQSFSLQLYKVQQYLKLVFFPIRPPLGLLPVLGPLEQYYDALHLTRPCYV